MKEQIKQLNSANITSDVFIISPAQLEYIAGIFGKNFADSMNMRTFSDRICEIAIRDGLIIGLTTEKNTISQSCDSVKSLCKNVPHLAVTLDPSCFIFGSDKIIDFDSLLEHVCHIRLRDTTPEKYQVQIGQGVLEYNRLVIGLNKVHYRGAFCADIPPISGLDQEVELRKMRLLLESLL